MVRLLRLVVPVGRGQVRSVSGPITVNAVEGETHGRGGGANSGDTRRTVASAALVASDLAGSENQRSI
jgi:hypothetical protein